MMEIKVPLNLKNYNKLYYHSQPTVTTTNKRPNSSLWFSLPENKQWVLYISNPVNEQNILLFLVEKIIYTSQNSSELKALSKSINTIWINKLQTESKTSSESKKIIQIKKFHQNLK